MVVKLVKGVKELFLRSLLTGNDLNIIDQQHIGCPIVAVEHGHPVQLDGRNHFVHKALAGGVHHVQAGIVVQQAAADGVHQVRLADADAAVNKKRVIAARGHLCHCLSSRMRQLVGRADDVGIKR